MSSRYTVLHHQEPSFIESVCRSVVKVARSDDTPASSAEFLRAAPALLVRRRLATFDRRDESRADCQAGTPRTNFCSVLWCRRDLLGVPRVGAAAEKVPDTFSEPAATDYFCSFTGTLTASGSGESKASEMFSPVPSTRAVNSSVSVSESNWITSFWASRALSGSISRKGLNVW